MYGYQYEVFEMGMEAYEEMVHFFQEEAEREEILAREFSSESQPSAKMTWQDWVREF